MFGDPPDRPPKSLAYVDILRSIQKKDADEMDAVMKSMGGPNKVNDLLVSGMIEPCDGPTGYMLTRDGKKYLSTCRRER